MYMLSEHVTTQVRWFLKSECLENSSRFCWIAKLIDIKYILIYMKCLLVQVGRIPLHVPSFKQVRCKFPLFKVYPELQV